MIFKESENIELKSVVVDDIKKAIISFANSTGGKLYIGVLDDGTVIGVDYPDEVALQVSNMIRDAIKPDLTMFLHYETLNIENKQVVVIDVQRGTNRPYYIAKKGIRPEGVYIRQGFSSAPASQSLIRQMIKETDGDYFENSRSIEQNLTFKTAKKHFAKKNLPLEEAQMKTLGILNYDGLYTNLGLLLSDQCIHPIKIASFEGENQAQFRDRKEISGSLFEQMEAAYAYIDFRNQRHSSFDSLYRVDQRDYPEMAIREALLNLLVHREYAYRASSLISIYADRIEFISMGGLPNGITLDDVMMGISVCRNEKLANIFYRLELIESYGTGIQKIMNAYSKTGKEPKIALSDHVFKIILPNINHISDSITHQTVENSQEAEILLLGKEQKTFTRKDVQNRLGVSQTTSGRLLKKSVADGLIIQEGKGRYIHYRLSE